MWWLDPRFCPTRSHFLAVILNGATELYWIGGFNLLDWILKSLRLLHGRCFVVGTHLSFSKPPANATISAFALVRCPACSHCLTFKPSSSIIMYFLVVSEDCSQESSIDFVFVMSDSNFIWGLLWLDGIKSQEEYDKLKACW